MIVNAGFHRVQRFSTDWHANSFAGSTVRKITRGMWALDSRSMTCCWWLSCRRW
jgi:ATP-binding cassette subfamily B protein